MTPQRSFWRSLTRAGLAFVHTYREEYLSPVGYPTVAETHRFENWDLYEARLFRYRHYDLYYANKAYTEIERYAQTHRFKRGLYRHTRAIYNPVFRLVELLASKAYNGPLDWELMHTGAIPFDRLDDAHRSAIRNLWKWSNMGSFKTRYPRNTARFGDSIIKVVDEPFKDKVRLELLHPGLIADATITPQGTFDRAVIGYWRQDDDPLSSPWWYEEVIDKDRFATYKNGEPYAEYVDADGTPITSWNNEYGFVPLVLTRAIELDKDWGAAPFFPTLDKIDQVNDLASITYDQVRKVVNPIFWLEGVSSLHQVQSAITGDDSSPRDQMPVMLGPIGSRPEAMVANLDIAAALDAINSILEEIEKDHPELALHKQRQGERVTAPGTLTAYDDAIQRFQDFRGVTDGGLLRAHQMALTIGGIRNYAGFSAFGADSYDQGDLDFEVAERPVLADHLTKKERVELLIQSNGPRRKIWSELGLTEAEIDEAEQDLEARQQAMPNPQPPVPQPQGEDSPPLSSANGQGA